MATSEEGGKRGGGKCGRTTANTTVWLMYKNECSFGCTITAFAALASIIPLGRKSEKFPEGMMPSGVANTVIVHPNERPQQEVPGGPGADCPRRGPRGPIDPARALKSKNQTLLLFHF